MRDLAIKNDILVIYRLNFIFLEYLIVYTHTFLLNHYFILIFSSIPRCDGFVLSPCLSMFSA